MEKVLLNMKAISKTFGSVQALKEVSLDLYAGEVLALMGENGAGKSTLMNILSGSLQPTKGEIYLKGEKVTVPGPIAAKKLGISKIHQELQIVPEMSVAENIFLGRWMKKRADRLILRRWLQRLVNIWRCWMYTLIRQQN